jgi:glycosyltransferase involved in cell wall biosynthesis
MRIALVHFTAAPVVGGVERVMDEHARLFASHGHTVTAVCLRGGDADTVRLPEGTAEVLAPVLQETFRRQDVVFLHNVLTMPFHMGLTEALWCVMDGLPQVRFVAWVHDVAASNPDYAPVSPLLSKCHVRCDYVAVSPLRARQFEGAAGLQAGSVRVVPNGFDPARVLGLSPHVAKFAEACGLFDGRPVLLHPTRIVRRKNIGLSIVVGREFATRGRPAAVLVTGAGDPHNVGAVALGEELRRANAHPPGVIFVGEHFVVGDSELAELFRIADALFLPSRSEGFGLPLLEAALHRMPVFCSDIEPLRDLLHETAAYFSPDAPPADVASLIEGTLAASSAYRERKRMLAEFSWSAIFRDHLEPLLAGRPGAEGRT